MNFLKFSGIIFIALCINGYATVNATCPAKATATGVEAQAILDFHNELRDKLGAKAKDMIELEWDSGDLQKKAEEEVVTCPADGGAGKNVGQGASVKEIMEGWMTKATVVADDGKVTPADSANAASVVEGAYINMVWSQSMKIGCAAADIAAGKTDPDQQVAVDPTTAATDAETTAAADARRRRGDAAKNVYLVCHYSPVASFDKNALAFKALDGATAASDCPPDFKPGDKYKNLCHNPKAVAPVDGSTEAPPEGDSASGLRMDPIVFFACLVVSTILLFAY